MNRAHKTRGFTIIELMLAMSFVAMLLLAIAMVTMQIGRIYNKGTTLRQVNQAGRAISDELQRSISNSAMFVVTPGPSSRFVLQGTEAEQTGGRLCVGRYAYIWNTGRSLAEEAGGPNKYTTGSAPVRFVKVPDSGASLCADPSKKIVQSDAIDMLDSGDRNLAIQKFSITPQATDGTTGQALYAVSFVVGTNERAQLVTGDTSCKPPAEAAGGEDYCAVNQFDIIARAGNKAGGR